MTDSERRDGGFVAFYRGYTKTWVHALATVALTAFGTLTTVHRVFVVVAIAAYLVPLVVQYARYVSGETERTADERGADAERRANADAAEVNAEAAEATGTNGGSASATGAESAAADPEPNSDPRWVAVDSPTDETLFDAAMAGDDAYAVGSGGVVLAGSGDGDDGWRVVLPDGPGAGGNALRGVDSVPGGVWVAGDGGAVGRVDSETGRHVDYSAPDGDTSNVTAVAAAGESGDETVLLADGSGRIRRGRYRDGRLSWDDPVKPGSGSSVAGVVLRDDGVGFLCDTNDGAYRTDDGGRTFESVGPVGADGTLVDAAAVGPETRLVADDDGVVHRYGGTTWTPERAGDATLTAVAASEVLAVSCADDGSVYERARAGEWDHRDAPASASIRGAAVEASSAVVVGDGGVVRRRECRT